MKTKATLAAVALLCVGAFTASGFLSPAATPPTSAPGSTPVTAAGGDADRGERALENVRTSVPVLLRGRCLAAEAGTPLVGCRIAAMVRPVRGAPEQTPASATTDAAGRFAIELDHEHQGAGDGAIVVGILAEDRAAMHAEFDAAPITGLDCGDIAIPIGATVHGVVATTDGRPQAGVQLSCTMQGAARPQQGFTPLSKVIFASDTRGVLVAGADLTLRLAPGRWRVAVNSPEHLLVSPAEFVVEPGRRSIELRVLVARLDERPAIRGTVVDEAGVPVGGLPLHADSGYATTGSDGAFAIHRRSDDGADASIGLDPSAVCTLLDPDRRYAWGSDGHRVVVARPSGLVLRVVADEDGTPVTRYGIRFFALDRPERTTGQQHRGEHENGVLRIAEVARGRHRILVYPEDSGRMPGAPLDVDLGPAGAMVCVRLERAHSLAVTVRTSSGEPVAGSRVQLFRQEGDGELGPYSNIGSAEFVYDTVVLPGAPAFVVLDSAVTDAGGRAVVHGPGQGRLGLRAEGGHVTLLRAPVTLPDVGRQLDLVVERGAAVRGAVRPAEVLRALRPDAAHWRRASGAGAYADAERPWPTLKLHREGGDRRVLPHRTLMEQPGFRIDDDGAFSIDGIPPGTWAVELQFGVAGAHYQRRVARIESLQDGEVRQLPIDVAALAPVTVSALLLCDGAPFGNAHVRIANLHCRADADGLFTATVPGGSWSLRAGDAPDLSRMICSDAELVLRADRPTPSTVALTHRRLRVRVLRADGTAAAKTGFAVTGVGYATTNADGWLTIDPAPPFPFWLVGWRDGLDDAAAEQRISHGASRSELQLRAGPLQMPLDRREAALEIALPR